jgi:hypothetical protein
MAPSTASQRQSMPWHWSYSSRPRRQNSRKTPAFVHSWKRRCAEDEEQIPVARSAFQVQPVRSTNRIACIAARSGTRGRWPPLGCGGGSGSNGCILAHNWSGICQRSPRITSPTAAPFYGRCAAHSTVRTIYRDRLLSPSAVLTVAASSPLDVHGRFNRSRATSISALNAGSFSPSSAPTKSSVT